MSKRFTDTEKWDRPWFRKLPNEYKLLWIFILDRCDIAGVWYIDFEMVQFQIGVKIEREKSEELFSKQIEVKSDRWLIKDFISFQYGILSESNKIYQGVSAKLNTFKEGASIPLQRGINGVKDKDKVKDKEKDVSISLEKHEKPFFEIPDDLKENQAEIKDWLEYKKQRGQSYKPKGLEALWRSLRAIPKDKRRESIDQSMANNWSGLFEKRSNDNGHKKNDGGSFGKIGEPDGEDSKFFGIIKVVDPTAEN